MTSIRRHTLPTAGALGLGILLLGGAHPDPNEIRSSRRAAGTTASTCAIPDLSNRARIGASGLSLSVGFVHTRVAVGRSAIIVVGNGPATDRQTTQPPAASQFRGLLIDLARGTTRTIPPPSPIGYLDHPVAAIDDEGVVHLVWADLSKLAIVSTDTVRTAAPAFDALWYAQYRGGRWSAPERVLSGPRVLWDNDAPDLSVTPDGLVLAFPAVSPNLPPTVHVARRSSRGLGGVWRVAHGGLDYFAAYANGVAMPNGSVVVAYAGPNRAVRGDGQAMHATVTADGGATWRPPVLVRGGDGRPSMRVRLVRTRSTIHMFWAQSTSEALRPELVEHAESRDEGTSWTRLAPMTRYGVHIHDFHAAADACDRVYVVLNVSNQGGQRLTVASQWTGGSWAAPDTLAGDDASRPTEAVHIAAGPYGGALAIATIHTLPAGADTARTVVWLLPRVKSAR